MERAIEIYRRLAGCTDDDLFNSLDRKIASEREHLVEILALIGVLDERRAVMARGSSSIYMYCTKQLKYCERTAFRRVAAARACRLRPILLDRLLSGRIHLTAIVLLADHFTDANVERLLTKVEGAKLEDVKKLAAALVPQDAAPPERTRIIAIASKDKLFVGLDEAGVSGKVSGGQESPSGELALTETSLVKFRTEHLFTLNEVGEAKLKRARELLAHKFPIGDLESVILAALDSLLDAVDPARRKPRPDVPARPADEQTRRIPEWVRRKVRARDEDRCAFVSDAGVRCGERRFLQFDHIVPWSLGGRSDEPANVRQLCGAHNRWAWRHAFVTRS